MTTVIMFFSRFSAKRLCLLAILLSGQPLGSLCEDAPLANTKTELLVLGTPTTSDSTTTATITITTTVAYKPSAIPDNPGYTLIGCYSQPSGVGGHVFGADEHDAFSDSARSKNLTIDSCVGACESATPPNNGRTALYMYAGLKNGSECICGLQLSTDAHKLSAGDCTIPCPGDSRLSCGGPENVAIYSLISRNVTNTQPPLLKSDPSNQGSSSTHVPITAAAKSTTGVGSQGTLSKIADSKATHSPSTGPSERKKLVSAPTIAGIIGSISGAFVIGAGLFVCYRAHKRKQLIYGANTKTLLDRRSTPSLILAQANIHSDITNIAAARSKREIDGIGNNGIYNGYDKADGEIPVKPILKSDEMYPVDLHARISAAAEAASRSGKSSETDSLYSTLMEEVRNGLGDNYLHAGASSAVQWGPGNASSSVPSTPRTPHHRKASSSGIVVPSPSADIKPLGERAWNQRRLSNQYRPPHDAGYGVAASVVPAALEAMSGRERGNMALKGAPSGPPNSALPSIPLNPEAREGPHTRSQSRPGPMFASRDVPTGTGARRPPMRPRRSLNALDFEVGSAPHYAPNIASTSKAGLGANEGKTLGMSHANASTPTLGRFGSITKSRRLTAETLMESPILGWRLQWGAPHRKMDEPDALADRQPTIPVLPPVAPGERFDHKRWTGTIYTEPRGSEDERKENRRQRRSGDLASPASVSSVGTSILFTSQEFDRRL
ncbi:hypothetical protein GGS21DRAFT_535005 [Xylaria nigripes]|nr:hypothetical protein GGS21DRAFT_535005 [Xylaria nigripes]